MLVKNNLATYLNIPNGAGDGKSLMIEPHGTVTVLGTATQDLLRAVTNKLCTIKEDLPARSESATSQRPKRTRPGK